MRNLILWLLLSGAAYAQTNVHVLMRRANYTGTNAPAAGALYPTEVAVNTNAAGRAEVWVGDASSNAVLVASRDFATTNQVNAAVASLASTSYVNSAVSGLTTNLTFLDASTNAFTGYITNGLWKGVSSP